MEIKEKFDNDRKEYINSLNFDNVYFEINNQLENCSLFKNYITIYNKDVIKYLGIDMKLEDMSNKERNFLNDSIMKNIISKLNGLQYIVLPRYSILSTQLPIGIDVYWDPNEVPMEAEIL